MNAGDNLLETLCACAALRSAARSATQLYDLVLQPAGVKTTQFIALRCIDQAGEIPQWRLAREHAIAVETLSRRLAALRKRGLVSVRTGGNHGERIYSLTAQGKELVNRTIPYWERAQKRLRQTLGDPELRLLLKLCESTVEAARKAEQLRAANSPQMHTPDIPSNAIQGKESAADAGS
jgi:DNA-binding MarR family transcriptional regulator